MKAVLCTILSSSVGVCTFTATVSHQHLLSITCDILSPTKSALINCQHDSLTYEMSVRQWRSASHLHRTKHNRLLIQCHPCPIWLLPLNLTYILLIILILFSNNLTYRDSWYSKLQISCTLVILKNPCPRPSEKFRNMLVFYDFLAPHPTPKLGDSPFSACHHFLFTMSAATSHINKCYVLIHFHACLSLPIFI